MPYCTVSTSLSHYHINKISFGCCCRIMSGFTLFQSRTECPHEGIPIVFHLLLKSPVTQFMETHFTMFSEQWQCLQTHCVEQSTEANGYLPILSKLGVVSHRKQWSHFLRIHFLARVNCLLPICECRYDILEWQSLACDSGPLRICVISFPSFVLIFKFEVIQAVIIFLHISKSKGRCTNSLLYLQ